MAMNKFGNEYPAFTSSSGDRAGLADRRQDRPGRAVALGVALTFFLVFICGSRSFAVGPEDYPPNTVVLENEAALIAVSPVGGTVVDYRRQGGVNVINTEWDNLRDSERIPEPTADARWFPLQGHTTWVGPQHEWWKHQSLTRDRGNWPPDPWLIYAEYEVAERSEEQVVMVSPDSPISGVRMTKTVRLLEDGRAGLEAEIINVRETPVAWSVWSNTRLPLGAHVYVPLQEDTPLRISEFRTSRPLRDGAMRYTVEGGFFSPLNQELRPESQREYGKAFIDGARPEVAVFVGSELFIKKAEKVTPPGQAPPKHSFVEIYSNFTDAGQGLLEAEMHSEYRELAPGETLSFAEIWELHPYEGPNERSAHREFLDRVLGRQ